MQTFADGVTDDRAEVRNTCALALCECICDKHAGVVPNGILIDVLVHILIPAIRVLGDQLVAEWHRDVLMSHPSSSPSWEVDEKEWIAVDKHLVTPQHCDNAVVYSIETLTKVITEHIKKLSAYPSFDKLWLQLLHIMSYFVGTQNSADHSLAHTRDNIPSSNLTKQQQAMLETLTTVSLANLESLIRLLIAENVFAKRDGLLAVTRDYLQQVRHGDLLIGLLTC